MDFALEQTQDAVRHEIKAIADRTETSISIPEWEERRVWVGSDVGVGPAFEAVAQVVAYLRQVCGHKVTRIAPVPYVDGPWTEQWEVVYTTA